ncbi:hypothetical protein ACLOJK_028353 [Asimina triloba]
MQERPTLFAARAIAEVLLDLKDAVVDLAAKLERMKMTATVDFEQPSKKLRRVHGGDGDDDGVAADDAEAFTVDPSPSAVLVKQDVIMVQGQLDSAIEVEIRERERRKEAHSGRRSDMQPSYSRIRLRSGGGPLRGKMMVAEYKAKFRALCKFASWIALDPQEKGKKFQRGLRARLIESEEEEKSKIFKGKKRPKKSGAASGGNGGSGDGQQKKQYQHFGRGGGKDQGLVDRWRSCGQPGHTNRECPVGVVCFKCG